MNDDRKEPRYRVSWPVRIRLDQGCRLLGRVVEAGARGIRVELLTWVPANLLPAGTSYRLEIEERVGSPIELVAEVRNVGMSGVGFELSKPLPAPLQRGMVSSASASSASLSRIIGARAAKEARQIALLLQQLLALLHSSETLMSALGRGSIGEALESLVMDALVLSAVGEWGPLDDCLSRIERLARIAARMDELTIDWFLRVQGVLDAARQAASVAALDVTEPDV